ncbi:uncharacterized protein V3H82_014185 [Fundulus diaphanus]
MSHPLLNADLSGKQPSTQIHNGPPVNDLPSGFPSIGPGSRLTSSGSSSATLPKYMSGQNTATSHSNPGTLSHSILQSVKTVEHQPVTANFNINKRNAFPSSSTISSASQDHPRASAAIDSTSLDWLPVSKPAAKTEAPECSYSYFATGFNNNQRVSSGEQVDNIQFPRAFGHHDNLAPDKSVLSESARPKHRTESAAEILQNFGLDINDLKELQSYGLGQITPENLSHILQQIFVQKQKRAAGMSSEAHPQLRGILKPSKVPDCGHSDIERTSSENSGQVIDSVPLDEQRASALHSKQTSLNQPDSGPSEPSPAESREKAMKRLGPNVLQACPSKKPKLSPLPVSETQTSSSKVFDILYGRVNVDSSGLKHQGSSKASSSKLPEFKESSAKGLPTLGMTEDYNGTQPRTMPHQCSLCFRIIADEKNWLIHRCSELHRENCRLFKKRYPEWFGETQPSHSKNATGSSATSDSLQRRGEESNPESSSCLSAARRGSEALRDESSCNDPHRHHSWGSRSNSHSPGSNPGSEENRPRSWSPSSYSPECTSEDEGRSRSPHSLGKADPSVGRRGGYESPETSVSPVETHQAKYTPETAAEILQKLGLNKEDLKELESYPEDQITVENLHLILSQIALRKKRRATAAGMSLDQRPQSPDCGPAAKCTGAGDKLKESCAGNSEAGGAKLPLDNPSLSCCKKKPLKKCVKGVKTTGLDSKSRPLKKKMKQKNGQPLKAPASKRVPLKKTQSASKMEKGGSPSALDPDSTMKKVGAKAAAPAGQKSKLQAKQKLIRQKLKQKNRLKCDGEAESKKAFLYNAAPAKLAPTKPLVVKASVSSHLPTQANAKDYVGIAPITFPHTCSICNKKCWDMQAWLSHQNSSFHLESCGILRTQYPQWDGEVLPLLCKRSPSSSPYLDGSESQMSRSGSSSRSPSYSPTPDRFFNRERSRSRSRSWSNASHHNGPKGRRERSIMRSRSPYDCGRYQRFQSQYCSSRYKCPSSPNCHLHSRSRERLSSSRNIDEKPFSPKRSQERQCSSRNIDEKPLSSKRSQEILSSSRKMGEKPLSPKRSQERVSSSSKIDNTVFIDLTVEKPFSPKRSQERVSSSRKIDEKLSSPKRSQERLSSSSKIDEKPLSPKKSQERLSSSRKIDEKPLSLKRSQERVSSSSKIDNTVFIDLTVEKPFSPKRSQERVSSSRKIDKKLSSPKRSQEKLSSSKTIDEKLFQS